MQRVVRLSLVGLLAIAAACGDKVTIPPATVLPTPTVGSNVLSVTVSPASVTLRVAEKVTMAASVNAEAGVTDRGVNWTSSDATIATVDATGIVTAVKAGTTTIRAAAKANTAVIGAAAVTVLADVATTVTISSLTQGGVAANTDNVAGQLDVTLNVDAGSASLRSVSVILKCGTDSIVETQTLSAALAAAAEAAAATAPVTISVNTARFDTPTGRALLRNGACTIRAAATTTSGAQSASITRTLTVNNVNALVGSVTATKSRSDAAGLVWNGDTIRVVVTPVIYTKTGTANDVATMMTVTLNAGGQTRTQSTAIVAAGLGPQTITYVDRNDPALLGDSANVDGITDANATFTVSVLGSTGQNFFVNAVPSTSASVLAGVRVPFVGVGAAAPFRLDGQKPVTLAAVNFPVLGNVLQNTGTLGYINGSFNFRADSASGFVGPNAGACPGVANTAAQRVCNLDNGGVDVVTYTFQTRVVGASATTFATRTSTSGLASTTTVAGYNLRVISTDALGNADTSGTIGTFGIDVTAPTIAFTAGEADSATFQASGVAGNDFFTITDDLSGRGTALGTTSVLTAQTREWNRNLTGDLSGFENNVYSNVGTGAIAPGTGNQPCMIGRFNVAAGGPNALEAFDRGGTRIGFCTPVPYTFTAGPGGSVGVPVAQFGPGLFTTRVVATDLAGNTGLSITRKAYVDDANPVVNTVDFPSGTAAGGSTVTATVTASDTGAVNNSTAGDIVAVIPQVQYTSGAIFQYAPDNSVGAPFDNVLSRLVTATPAVPNFIKSIFVSTNGTTPPPGTQTPNVASFNFYAADASNRFSAPVVQAVGTSPAVTGTNTVYAGGVNAVVRTFTGGFLASASPTTITNCPTAGCSASAANATSTTVTASASGTSGTFTNPFSRVEVWYRPSAGGPWFLAGTATVTGSTDDGTTRMWNYSFTFDPPSNAPKSSVNPTGASLSGVNVDVIVLGMNANGDAIQSNTVTITTTNP